VRYREQLTSVHENTLIEATNEKNKTKMLYFSDLSTCNPILNGKVKIMALGAGIKALIIETNSKIIITAPL